MSRAPDSRRRTQIGAVDFESPKSPPWLLFFAGRAWVAPDSEFGKRRGCGFWTLLSAQWFASRPAARPRYKRGRRSADCHLLLVLFYHHPVASICFARCFGATNIRRDILGRSEELGVPAILGDTRGGPSGAAYIGAQQLSPAQENDSVY